MQWGGLDWRCCRLWLECLQSILCLAVTYYIFPSTPPWMNIHWNLCDCVLKPFSIRFYNGRKKLLLPNCTSEWAKSCTKAPHSKTHRTFFLERPVRQNIHSSTLLWFSSFNSSPLHKGAGMLIYMSLRWWLSLLDLCCRCNRPMRGDRSPGDQRWTGAQGSGSSETHSF